MKRLYKISERITYRHDIYFKHRFFIFIDMMDVADKIKGKVNKHLIMNIVCKDAYDWGKTRK